MIYHDPSMKRPRPKLVRKVTEDNHGKTDQDSIRERDVRETELEDTGTPEAGHEKYESRPEGSGRSVGTEREPDETNLEDFRTVLGLCSLSATTAVVVATQ